jgi:hypothetical protein
MNEHIRIPEERRRMARRAELRIRSIDEAVAEERAADPLDRFFVRWDDLTTKDVIRLERALKRARVERDMQTFLEKHPDMLIQHLGGGHGRWVIPQARLGIQHVTDFLISDRDSTGRHWTAVELEGPERPIFNRNGDPSRYLWHAVRQIIDWRVWLEMNRDYASRPHAQNGLDLEGISANLPGLILIGRRQDQHSRRNLFRKALARQLDIEIHSYDWLVDRASGRVSSLQEHRRSR